MRHYPYFFSDLLLLFAFALSVALALALQTVESVFLPVLIIIAILAVLKYTTDGVRRMEEALSIIPNVRSWDSDFLSFGALVLDYRGMPIRYSSQVGREIDGTLPVEFKISLANGSPVTFRAFYDERTKAFAVEGNKIFFAMVREELTSFDRKYALIEVRNSDGLLRIHSVLGFVKPEAPGGGITLSSYLQDLFELGYSINCKLKGKKKSS
jgi:hypothetical protein